MTFKCTTEAYDVLYSRWLSNPGSLLDLAEFNPRTDRLLDLCGGTGAVSVDAVGRGAVYDPTILDLNPRCLHPRVLCLRGDAHIRDDYLGIGSIDLVVIRQSIGYLDLKRVFPHVYDVLSPGGRMAFNAFLKPRWKASTYKHASRTYFEASAHAFGRVAHIQASPFVGIDVSLFRHHETGRILEALTTSSFDEVRLFSSGRSIRVLAIKAH